MHLLYMPACKAASDDSCAFHAPECLTYYVACRPTWRRSSPSTASIPLPPLLKIYGETWWAPTQCGSQCCRRSTSSLQHPSLQLATVRSEHALVMYGGHASVFFALQSGGHYCVGANATAGLQAHYTANAGRWQLIQSTSNKCYR